MNPTDASAASRTLRSLPTAPDPVRDTAGLLHEDPVAHIPDAASAFELLDRAHQAQISAEVAQLVAIAAAADHYRINDGMLAAGVGALVEGGHDGTPLVSEWLCLEVAGLLQISPVAAAGKVSQTLDLRHRFKRLWDLVLAGRVRVWQAMKIVSETAALSRAAAAKVDACAALAMPGQAFAATMRQLPGWIVAADPDAARERALAEAERRRVSVSNIQDGHVSVFGLVDAADGIAFDQALSEIAHTLDLDQDRGRAAAVGILARQAFGQDTLPAHTLVVHLNPDSPKVSHIDDWGPLLTDELPAFLKDSKVTVRPIVDARTLAPADRHDPSPAMRFAVVQRDGTDRFPWGTLAAGKCDLDHTEPYQDGWEGQTRPDNLGALSRKTHRAKTYGGWRLTQVDAGVFHWRSPLGYEYLVDRHGSRRVGPRSDSPALGPDADRIHGAKELITTG